MHITAREGEMCTSSSLPLDEPYVLTSHSDCWMHVLASLLGNPYLCIVLSSHMKKLESGYRMHHCHHHEGPASSCLARKPTLDKSFQHVSCLLLFCAVSRTKLHTNILCGSWKHSNCFNSFDMTLGLKMHIENNSGIFPVAKSVAI